MIKKSLNFTDNHMRKKLNRKNKVITDINICTIDVNFFVQVKERKWSKHTKKCENGRDKCENKILKNYLTVAATF